MQFRRPLRIGGVRQTHRHATAAQGAAATGRRILGKFVDWIFDPVQRPACRTFIFASARLSFHPGHALHPELFKAFLDVRVHLDVVALHGVSAEHSLLRRSAWVGWYVGTQMKGKQFERGRLLGETNTISLFPSRGVSRSWLIGQLPVCALAPSRSDTSRVGNSSVRFPACSPSTGLHVH